MKKLMMIVGLLIGSFIMVGCVGSKIDDKIVAIGKVDILNYCDEYCRLTLKLVTSDIVEEIKVMGTDATEAYVYEVEKPIRVSLMDKANKANIYLINFKFSHPTEMTTLKLKLDQDTYDFNIGKFKCVAYEKTLTTIAKKTDQSLKVTQITPIENMQSYVYPTQVSLYFENMTNENIYIENVSLVVKPDNYEMIVVKSLGVDKKIKVDQIVNFAYVYYNSTDLSTMHTSGIIQIDYLSQEEIFRKYVLIDCGYTEELVKSNLLDRAIYLSTLSLGVKCEEPTV